jgi:hypothetical protein
MRHAAACSFVAQRNNPSGYSSKDWHPDRRDGTDSYDYVTEIQEDLA